MASSTYRLPSTCKVLLIGDWGTHMTDNVALLRQALKKLHPDAIIHLGDVYYSGTRQECRENVVNVSTRLVAELKIKRPPFFTLPGNHDYYSGGRGFYEMIARDQSRCRAASRKPATSACAPPTTIGSSSAWIPAITIAIRSTKASPGLVHSEIAWHRDKLENFSGTTVLLSHHQLFSAKEVLQHGGRHAVHRTLSC